MQKTQIRIVLYSIVICLVMTAFSMIMALRSVKVSQSLMEVTISNIENIGSLIELISLNNENIITHHKKIEAIDKHLNNIKEISPDSEDTLRISSEIESVRSEVRKLNEAITDNPEKVLSLTLLKNDMKVLKDKTVYETDSLKKEVERYYQLFKWLIGLFAGAFAILLGLAVANFFRYGRAEDK